MALILLGKTICRLCNRPLLEVEGIVAFTAFLPQEHELSRYSDAGFHQRCFEASPDCDAVLALYRRITGF